MKSALEHVATNVSDLAQVRPEMRAPCRSDSGSAPIGPPNNELLAANTGAPDSAGTKP